MIFAFTRLTVHAKVKLTLHGFFIKNLEEMPLKERWLFRMISLLLIKHDTIINSGYFLFFCEGVTKNETNNYAEFCV